MQHQLTDAQATSSGVYALRNTLDARVYIGASKRLLTTFLQARQGLRRGKHNSDRLQAFATAHGLAVLRFDVLEYCPAHELVAAKQRHLDEHQASDPAHGFNILSAPVGAGQRLSAEGRARISAGKKGRSIAPRTPEHQEKLAAAHRGRKRSPETCAAISAATAGKPKRRTIPHSQPPPPMSP